MQAGDTITEINGHKVRVYRDVQLELFKNQDRPVTVEYTREGENRYRNTDSSADA